MLLWQFVRTFLHYFPSPAAVKIIYMQLILIKQIYLLQNVKW